MTEQPISPDITSDDKLWAALSYAFSPLIPLILMLMDDKKERPFIKFHAVQSLVVGIILFVIVPIIAIFTLGCGSIVWFIMFYWAYKAYQGEIFDIPIITDFIKGQGWVN